MEYRLNKIDMEVRERINEATSEKKIHRKDGVHQVSNKTDKSREEKKFILYDEEEKGRKVETLAMMDKEDEVGVEAFKDAPNGIDPDRGSILDVRK